MHTDKKDGNIINPEVEVPANPTDTIDNSANASNGITSTASNQDQTDNTNMSAQPPADVPANEQDATSIINPEVVTSLHHLLSKATGSAFYMSNAKRVEALEAALNIPVSDDKSFQQFFNHAEKDLVAEAYKNARKNGGTPAEVTNVQIMAEAQKRYVAKHGKLALVNEEYMAV